MSDVRPGVISFDAGENLAGWARVTFHGPRGRQVTLRFLEELGPDYHQADHYYLKGGGPESWEPRFTWHGFRHMEMIGAAGVPAPAPADVEFCAVHSDVARAGRFECASPLLNRLFENFGRTQLANMHGGVPSDCPHRERLGYTGDGQVASEAAILAFDMAAFYTKWLQDIADAQNQRTGFVPHSAPFGGGAGGYAWGAAIVVLPWRLYVYYGDRRVLEQTYPAMVRWVDYCTAKVDKQGILTGEEPSHVWIGETGRPPSSRWRPPSW
jgi:alpha-L-rhamnosidase